MTDNEIRKALECCVIGKDCYGCPLNTDNSKLLTFSNCFEKTRRNALDLINRQKAEIERLNKTLIFEINSAFERGKAEAYKEFAEGLKEMDGYNNHTFDDCASILISEEYKKGRYEKTREIWNTIDYLLKEKVGAENVD